MKRTARIRLEAGPAPETTICPRRTCLKFRGFTGHGLAQPKRNPAPVKIMRSGITTVPRRSMWTRGLRLMRPRDWAVGSPSFSAVQAWADSWTDRLNSSTTYRVRPMARVSALSAGSFEGTKP